MRRARTRAAASQWPELPPDLLREISGRLHVAVDFVRFHAVCRSWRGSLDAPAHAPPRLLPWLLAPSAAADVADQWCRCVFSGSTYRAPGICVRDKRVACADGTAAWVVRGRHETALAKPLTAARHETALVNPLSAARLPFSPGPMDEWPDFTHRIVSDDGTLLMFDFDLASDEQDPRRAPLIRFKGATLYRGHEEWTHLSKRLGACGCCNVAYHDGLTVCVDLDHCHILWPTQNWIAETSYYYMVTSRTRVALPDEPGKVRHCSYLLEFRGKLLLASVQLREPFSGRLATILSVSVHALDNADKEEDKWWMRWEWDDATGLIGDHVLFLGFPGSFAVDAARFGGEVSGGSAYFVVDSTKLKLTCSGVLLETCIVYRYSFQDGVATRVETLPPGWNNARCMWFLPQPGIVPISAPATSGQQQAPATCSRTRRQQLTIYAGDLAPKVDSSRLRQIFSKHGKVARAKVAYDRRGRSRGFGFVTMATQEGFDNAMAALGAVEEPKSALASFCTMIMLFILSLIFLFSIPSAVNAMRFLMYSTRT